MNENQNIPDRLGDSPSAKYTTDPPTEDHSDMTEKEDFTIDEKDSGVEITIRLREDSSLTTEDVRAAVTDLFDDEAADDDEPVYETDSKGQIPRGER